MKTPSRGMIFYLIIILVAFSGCSVIGGLGPSGEPVNYALSSNGAAALASNFTPGHDPYTAINGVTSSDGWDDGEGWECRFSRERLERGRRSRTDPKSVMEFGSAWLEVQFAGPRSINRVTVYTLDSAEYPAIYHGIQDAWLQLWKERGWSTVGEIKGGNIASRVNLERRPAGGKMVFKFDHTETEKVKLSDLKGKIVVATFWAAWSPQSKQQVSVLSKLHKKYKDQDVVVIGISVDEGGAERVRPFVQRSILQYTILLADTSTKSAYGGIGTLPSTFVIDQEGNIQKEYFGYQGEHILELDIKRLLPRE